MKYKGRHLFLRFTMGIFTVAGLLLSGCYNSNGERTTPAYDMTGTQVFPDGPELPVPSGNLNASETVLLPDIYEPGKGFTCTGLAYDGESDTFLVGDIGALLPGGTIKSQLVRLSSDFVTVVETIPLFSLFPGMGDVQGVTIDTSDGTIWLCSPSENKIHHITANGTALGSINATSPTGLAYSAADNTFWVLNYSNQIVHMSKDGAVLATFEATYGEALDQCFLDEVRGVLYITAGTNYSGRNNVYTFDTTTHQQGTACTVDAYSVEGIWIGETRMVIVNDGYYHSAAVPKNQANIYNLQ